MTTLTAAVLAAILVVAPMGAQAQLAPLAPLVQVEPGARVRGQAPAAGMKRFDATVIANTGDTIVIAKNGEVTRLPVERIRRLELYRGLDKKAGLRFGTVAGASSGFLFGGYAALIASAHASTSASVNRHHSLTKPGYAMPSTPHCRTYSTSRRNESTSTSPLSSKGVWRIGYSPFICRSLRAAFERRDGLPSLLRSDRSPAPAGRRDGSIRP